MVWHVYGTQLRMMIACAGSFLALAAPFTIWVVRMMMHEGAGVLPLFRVQSSLCPGEPTIDLQMWLDLRAAACEQGRALSLAWLRVACLQEGCLVRLPGQ